MRKLRHGEVHYQPTVTQLVGYAGRGHSAGGVAMESKVGLRETLPLSSGEQRRFKVAGVNWNSSCEAGTELSTSQCLNPQVFTTALGEITRTPCPIFTYEGIV